jgi:hypothetical protein
LVTVCVVTRVLSAADEVAEAGSAIVLFWKSALEVAEEEPVAAVFKDTLDVIAAVLPAVLFWNGASEATDEELTAALFTKPVAAVFKDMMEVVDAAEPAVLFWNGASEAIEEEPIASLFMEPTNTVFTEPVAAVFKSALDEATPAVLFWNGAPEVSGVGTTLPEGVESVVPLAEDSTWKAEHMLAVFSPETNSPVSLLR